MTIESDFKIATFDRKKNGSGNQPQGHAKKQAHFGTFFHGGSFGPTDIDSGTIDGAIEGTETETDIAATHLLAIDGNGQYLFYIDRNQHLWQVRLPL